MTGLRAILPVTAALAALLAAPAGAQVPEPRPDSSAARPAVVLPDITVTVRRSDERLDRLPAAVTVLDSTTLGRGRPGLGADEALAGVPGLYVANRYNYSLDQRLSIRGFGSRANFGVRGVKVLLDGVPQTLPDGQTQLGNVDWATIRRVEVLRGPAAALYGNASGGVIALETGPPGGERPGAAVQAGGGSFGLVRWLARSDGRAGRLGAAVSAGGYTIDGFRQHSRAETFQLNARAQYALASATSAAIRFAHADAPRAENPGALTLAELEARRDSAAANNILRGADKDVRQDQLSLALRHAGPVSELSVAFFGLTRRLRNPLATNTYVSIDRRAGGVRATGTRALRADSLAPRLSAGIDAQRLRDDRTNYLSDGGEPTDSVQLDQQENVTELGAFLQATWRAAPRVTLSLGGRRDDVTFDVADRHLGDGADNSGRRRMTAWSWNAGASYSVSPNATAYANVATAFETPTTTELANDPSGAGGFNGDLGPQRSVSYEAGMRGGGHGVGWSAAAFAGRVRDAIVQYEEIGGRAFLRNAGRLHQDGVELAVNAAPLPPLHLGAAYTLTRYRFAEYRPAAGTSVDTLDGNRLPGVPRHFLRVVLLAEPLRDMTLDVEHSVASSLFADDANTLEAPGWGIGVTSLRLTWTRDVGALEIAPSGGVNNVFGRRYVGSVTINGANGRVYEPAPGRNFYIGAEARYRRIRASSPGPGR